MCARRYFDIISTIFAKRLQNPLGTVPFISKNGELVFREALFLSFIENEDRKPVNSHVFSILLSGE